MKTKKSYDSVRGKLEGLFQVYLFGTHATRLFHGELDHETPGTHEEARLRLEEKAFKYGCSKKTMRLTEWLLAEV